MIYTYGKNYLKDKNIDLIIRYILNMLLKNVFELICISSVYKSRYFFKSIFYKTLSLAKKYLHICKLFVYLLEN